MNSLIDSLFPPLAAQPLRSLLLDFNSYFASVEQEVNPALRGKAVGILPVMAETSCCIAASYEAKAFGIKTGTSVREARQRCPSIVFLEARHALYVEFHHRAVQAIDEIAPIRQVLSIDEVECELTGRWRERDAALKMAHALKAQVKRKVGVTLGTSIGIAPNTLLAKLASNMQKPHGLTVLEHGDIPQAFVHLSPSVINGIGPRMHARLERAGIVTMQDLYAAPPALLRTVWGGVAGLEMYDMLRGVPYAPRQSERKSIGHSHVLPPAMRNLNDARQVLHRLLQKAAMRLRKYMLYCTGLALHIRIGPLYAYGGAERERAPRYLRRIECGGNLGQTQDTAFLLGALDTLWHNVQTHYAKYAITPNSHPPSAVGLVLFGLVPASQHTPSLFEDTLCTPTQQALRPIHTLHETTPRKHLTPHSAHERSRLLETIDRLNVRYGKDALHFASTHGALHHAPMRIAFSQIPDLDTER